MNSAYIVFLQRQLELAKLAPFLAASAALHTLVFFWPAFDSPRGLERMIPVTIIEPAQPLGGSGATDTAKTPQKFPHGASAGKKRRGVPFYRPSTGLIQAHKSAPEAGARPQKPGPEALDASPAEPAPLAVAVDNPSAPPKDAGSAAPASTVIPVRAGLPGGPWGADNSRGVARSGEDGSGSASGVGNGYGSSHGVGFTQARYTETPKPHYPENARREGKEGRVLLRVLVDREGNSKNVEISGSSGSETLDRAAAETIKRWRFSPARYGDTPVESWVRIPIDFRLRDARDE